MSAKQLKPEPAITPSSRILVTGASCGIGQVLVKLLCLSSCRIGYHAQSPASTEVPKDILALAQQHGAKIKTLSGNLATSDICVDLIHRFNDFWDGIDALVQLHGDAHSIPINELSDDDWNDAIRINLTSPFFLAREATNLMRRQGRGGRITLTSTASAKHGGGSDTLPYGVAKAGIECLVKALAKDGAPDNILINAIAPGFIETSFHTQRLGRSHAQLEKRKMLVPLQRAGSPEEVAQTIIFLLSSASSFITGQTIEISGGDWL